MSVQVKMVLKVGDRNGINMHGFICSRYIYTMFPYEFVIVYTTVYFILNLLVMA